MKRAIGIAAGALLAAVCLWLFFRGVDGAALGRSLREANPLLIALLCLSSVGHMALRAWRWRTLLGEEGRGVPYGELFSAVCIGYMAGVLPGRVSEVLRPAALSRRTRAPFGAALATVGAERFLLDLPMIVLFGGVFLALPSGFGGLPAGVDDKLIAEVRAAGLVLALASVAGLAFVSWLARRREAADALIASWAAGHGSFVCKIAAFLRTLLPGLQGFGSARGLARLGAETAAIWLVICAGIHCGVASCGVSLPLFAHAGRGRHLPHGDEAGPGRPVRRLGGGGGRRGARRPRRAAARHLGAGRLLRVARRARGPQGRRGGGAMKCPYCGSGHDRVVDSRESNQGETIRRRRECLGCRRRFTSYERVEDLPVMVVKKDGRRELFDRQKLLSGLLKACEKRPVSPRALEEIVEEVAATAGERQEREIPTADIGAKVMERLRELDQVAYVRFASVYRQFSDVQEFLDELRNLIGPAGSRGREGVAR